MKKTFIPVLFLLFTSMLGAQQLPFVDMGASSIMKPYFSEDNLSVSIWKSKDHSCTASSLNNPAVKYFSRIPKKSQSNLESMAKGNVRFSNQILSGFEWNFFESKALKDTEGAEAIGCLTGLYISPTMRLQNDHDYFRTVQKEIRFLKEKQKEKYYIGSRAYRCELIQTQPQVEEVLKDPLALGMVVSIKGGNCLGAYLPIAKGLVETDEYQNSVLKNVDRLKGLLPLEDNSSEYIEIPIFSFSFANIFADGLCGKNKFFTEAEEKILGGEGSVGKGLTALGQKVVKKLVSSEGNRILIDVSGMTPDARKWYYDFVKNARYMGDTIPILATCVSISGLNATDDAFASSDKPSKNSNSWLNNYQSSLSRQDIQNIFQSEGLISVTLDKRKLTTFTKFEKEMSAVVPGSSQERDLDIKIVAANLCKIVHIIQDPAAWDMISISSEFDYMTEPLGSYASSDQMDDFARDLTKFLTNPTDIGDLLTAEQIKQYMYDFTPEDIVAKIMSTNAMGFISRNIGKKKSKTTTTANQGKN